MWPPSFVTASSTCFVARMALGWEWTVRCLVASAAVAAAAAVRERLMTRYFEKCMSEVFNSPHTKASIPPFRLTKAGAGRGKVHGLAGTMISRASTGTSVVVVWPPGQRTTIWVGRPAPPMTCTVLSCDQ